MRLSEDFKDKIMNTVIWVLLTALGFLVAAIVFIVFHMTMLSYQHFTRPDPMFSYLDRVEVTQGFYKGMSGVIVGESSDLGSARKYSVDFDGSSLVESVLESDLQPKKAEAE